MCNLFSFLIFIFFANGSLSIPLFSVGAIPGPKHYTPLIHQTGGEEHVVLFSSENRPSAKDVLNRIGLHEAHYDVLHTYNNLAYSGFAARIHDHCAAALKSMPDVYTVERAVNVSVHAAATRDGTTWGLQRISSRSPIPVGGDPFSLRYTYTYDAAAPGAGVDVYIVDTGIYTANYAFGGRAHMVYPSASATDEDGHGTHVAGTAAGGFFGVAPGANLLGVKVLGADGAGSVSSVVAGVDFVLRQHAARERQPGFVASVMSMSLSIAAGSTVLSRVLAAAAGRPGLHVTVAAGNYGSDACDASPASSGGRNSDAVMTVGSVGVDDGISGFSNTGPCVDVYAPGEQVVSAWIGERYMMKWLSGTSMATPHVAGVVAYLAAKDPELARSPQAMKARVVGGMGMPGIVGGSALAGDAKVLLNNGADA